MQYGRIQAELREMLIKKGKIYNLGRTYTKKCFNNNHYTSNFGDYETEYFYGYPDKYLDLPVISYMVRYELTTILVYGGDRNE